MRKFVAAAVVAASFLAGTAGAVSAKPLPPPGSVKGKVNVGRYSACPKNTNPWNAYRRVNCIFFGGDPSWPW